MEMALFEFEFLNGVTLKNNGGPSSGQWSPQCDALQKGKSLTQNSSASQEAELCVIWSPTQVTNSPLPSACENKVGQQWGSNQSCAVTLSGMLMSLQVIGGQWAPHGPTHSFLAPCVSFSLHTHKETPLAQGHISDVFPIERTGCPSADMLALCNVSQSPQVILEIWSIPGIIAVISCDIIRTF